MLRSCRTAAVRLPSISKKSAAVDHGRRHCDSICTNAKLWHSGCRILLPEQLQSSTIIRPHPLFRGQHSTVTWQRNFSCVSTPVQAMRHSRDRRLMTATDIDACLRSCKRANINHDSHVDRKRMIIMLTFTVTDPLTADDSEPNVNGISHNRACIPYPLQSTSSRASFEAVSVRDA